MSTPASAPDPVTGAQIARSYAVSLGNGDDDGGGLLFEFPMAYLRLPHARHVGLCHDAKTAATVKSRHCLKAPSERSGGPQDRLRSIYCR